MEPPIAAVDTPEVERTEDAGRKASLALQRALHGTGAWMAAAVRDQRKCDHALLPAEMPAHVREKVAKILQDRGIKENVPAEATDPKAPWHQQLEQHVARLMQRMRGQPQQFRQLLLMAASESSADCVISSPQAFVDSRRAYRRLRRAAMALGEEIYYFVRAFVRRSEVNGVFPLDAQVVRLASLYKLELRRHVTISAVMECIHEADSVPCVPANKIHGLRKPGFCVIKKVPYQHPLLRRQVKSAGVSSRRSSDLDATSSPRAASAPTEGGGRGSQNQQATESDKIKSVHAFKLQALERLLAKTWPGSRAASMRLLQSTPVTPVKLSDETIVQIQERVTAFLYHRSRENYPLWSEPLLSREETARHLRTLVATLLATPLLQSLNIEQLLEVGRAARWQIISPGETLCVRNTDMEALIIVMDGSLTSSAALESPAGPSSPPPSASVVVSAPACLGEIGMVRSTERWPRTLVAQAPDGAKALVLPRLTFEALLHRFFNGSKAMPQALAAVANLLQPRRPSSSPAVVARRLARTFRGSLSGRRPSTAVPTAATEANVARWHEVRDEKLRDYRAGLEAEQRAAALEALQRAMEELSTESPDHDDQEFLQHATGHSPQNSSWSRHEYYPKFEPASGLSVRPEHDLTQSAHSIAPIVPKSPNTICPSNNGSHEDEAPISHHDEALTTSESSTDVADQLREFYRSLNARRSVMRARLASSAPSAQLVQLSPERKKSTASPTNHTALTATSETNWWAQDGSIENLCDPSFDELGLLREVSPSSVSDDGSPYQGRRQSASFSTPRSSLSAPSSPARDSYMLASPLQSSIKSSMASPLQSPNRRDSKVEIPSERIDTTWISGDGKAVPEAYGTDGEAKDPQLVSPSKNQIENSRATEARKSALNIMLMRQSTATMARHSKILDKDAAQQVLVQKHFADSLAGGGNLGSPRGSRPSSGRSHSGHHSEISTPDLQQNNNQAPLPLRADLQRRLDSVLNDLHMPPKAKLDLVLRYTQADHYDQFPIAVQLWERVQVVVSWRERVMKSLWDFEMLASDPRRHFRSISTHRLREEKERDALFSKLNQSSNACLDAMDELFRCCGDTVCLGDRSYRDKMKKDYTELLYEVEQERLRIIYNGIRPHVAPAVDECDNENGPANEEMGKWHSRPSSGRTLINVRVPSAIAIPCSLSPRRPLFGKDSNSSKLVASTDLSYKLEGEKAEIPSNIHDNQEHENVNTDNPSIKFAIAGVSAGPTDVRYQLTTPRESIFVPVDFLDNKQEPTPTEPELEQPIRRVSRVTVQVQQQRQAELAAINRQNKEDQNEPSTELLPSTQTIRSAETTFVAPVKEAKSSAVRSKHQQERASLRELFQQFITRSKT
ncbi:unnamed protein product [Phytophthora fragariaefolia]|uniref:Unnamed protein product n=1 Tax=Phytophthora fragariaefolia TaxID=1490495 RepID=A0A9W6WY05_9STRA|nr:unnamed protein product [Phytophthora fragariaefolia]